MREEGLGATAARVAVLGVRAGALDGALVGTLVGAIVGALVGALDGDLVGLLVGHRIADLGVIDRLQLCVGPPISNLRKVWKSTVTPSPVTR